MYLKVAGVTFENRQEIIKNELDIGDTVRFVREQNNKFDRYAVRIETLDGKQIGYVPKESSERFCRLLSKDATFFGSVVAIRGFSQDENYGVGIYIDARSPESTSRNYISKKIRHNGYEYRLIDNKISSCYLSLIDIAYNVDTKNLKLEDKFQTISQKLFFTDDQYYVQNISPRTFLNNKNIENLDKLHVHSIGDEAFKNCINLKDLNCRSKYIDDSVFENCTNLESVFVVPSRIGNSAFKNCSKIKNITITELNRNSVQRYFCNGGVEYIGESAFEGCSNIEKIDISETFITAISKRTFANCINLKEIVLPHTINVIEAEAFMNCTSLEKVTCKGELYKIDTNAFANCKKLKSVIFMDNVNKISSFAFTRCENLSEVKFRKHLYEIEPNAFDGCDKLAEIRINVDKKWIETNLKAPKSFNIKLIAEKLLANVKRYSTWIDPEIQAQMDAERAVSEFDSLNNSFNDSSDDSSDDSSNDSYYDVFGEY